MNANAISTVRLRLHDDARSLMWRHQGARLFCSSVYGDCTFIVLHSTTLESDGVWWDVELQIVKSSPPDRYTTYLDRRQVVAL